MMKAVIVVLIVLLGVLHHDLAAYDLQVVASSSLQQTPRPPRQVEGHFGPVQGEGIEVDIKKSGAICEFTPPT